MSTDDFDRRVVQRELCEDCKFFWAKKYSCQLFEKTDISERVLHVYKDEPSTCSAKEYSGGSNYQFLRCIYYSLSIQSDLSVANARRLCTLANQEYSLYAFNPQHMYAAAIKNQGIDPEHF